MPNTSNTVPNQRTIHIHRERPETNFLGIKNENWMAAARDLSAHALKLYMYFAANANNYTFAFSPAAVLEAIGMPKSTCHDQFTILVNKGYLVLEHGNTYSFYEVPQPRPAQQETKKMSNNPISADGVDFENYTTVEQPKPFVVDENTGEVIEINNITESTNNTINNSKSLWLGEKQEQDDLAQSFMKDGKYYF